VCGGAGGWFTGFEDSDFVKEELKDLRGKKTEKKTEVRQGELQNLGQAPEIVGISGWLNTENGKAINLADLRGKVVLIDFWTYSCINCIRTLPYVQSWYQKYQDDGFVVIGVHTPEFLFEHKKDNVLNAIKKYDLTYPVAQDNDYATWTAFENRYWPAHYLIDKDGNIRYTHFGEGNYDKTEESIKTLLKEAGATVSEKKVEVKAEASGSGTQTRETYLGADRLERFQSLETPVIGTRQFTFNKPLLLHNFAFGGEWTILGERSIAAAGSRLAISYKGKKVFLVISASTANSTARVMLDGETLSEGSQGKDVKNGRILVTEERLYEIISTDKVEEHTLEIEFQSPGMAVYAFTFS
jgi:thiol-disulfide isomerase/thioredoxin